MYVKKVSFKTTPLSKPIGLVDLILFVVGPGLAAWLATDDSFTGLVYGAVGFVVVALIKSILRYRSQKVCFDNAKVH